MAYTDDAVLSKLSALNDSHDSIATAAQWIMFHRRHAERTVHLWLTKLKELPSQKRLNLVYLANEVVQQSKARHKDDFTRGFSPIIAEAAAVAYRGASSDIQAKLRRVIDVWRDRNIFERHVQDEVESRLTELDKTRNATKVGGFSGSLFGSSSPAIPTELSALVAPQQTITKIQTPMALAIKTANAEYDKLNDPTAVTPSAPVYAARLNGLMMTLATAEGAVAECVKARQELVGALGKLLQMNRDALQAEESQLNELGARKTTIEGKKQEVEVSILRGLSGNEHEKSGEDIISMSNSCQEPDRPEVEALTPPHVGADDDDMYDKPSSRDNESLPAAPVSHSSSATQQTTFPSAPGIEMLSHLASAAQYQAVPVNGSSKKRKVAPGDDFPDLGNDDGIDADVTQMIMNERREGMPGGWP